VSLRNRIAVYYTAATAVLIALVFTTLYLMVDRVVYRHFDRELTMAAARVARITVERLNDHPPEKKEGLEREKKDEDRRKHRRERLRAEFIQYSASDGTPISRSGNLGRNILPVKTGSTGTIYFNSTVGGLAVRQVQLRVEGKGETSPAWISVARPLGDAIAMLGDLRRVLMLSFPAILITLFALTRAIAAKSIRPVEEAIMAAENITREHFDRRIPLPVNHDELYRLSATFNALLDRLQEAFNREKQFTADASHELKTPLSAVQGTLEVLIRRPREREHYEERIRFCLLELHRMTGLIEQLLLLARHDATEVAATLRSIDINTLIREVAMRQGARAGEKDITIQVPEESSCIAAADREMLGIILDNIIANAVNYSPRSSTVTIKTGTENGVAFCTVSDMGKGIEESKLEAVFERFYRVDASRSSGSGGSGLGLSIVKKLADLQGITVRAESRPGEGATFRLLFPPRLFSGQFEQVGLD
jgi:two-component system heavy metal sensor histidine kinase CusS